MTGGTEQGDHQRATRGGRTGSRPRDGSRFLPGPARTTRGSPHIRRPTLAPDVPLLANLGAVQTSTSASEPRMPSICFAPCEPSPGAAPETPCRRRSGIRPHRVSADCSRASRRALRKNLGAPVIVKEVGLGYRPTPGGAPLRCGALPRSDVARSRRDVVERGRRHRKMTEPGRRPRGRRHSPAGGLPKPPRRSVRARSAAPGDVLIASGGVRDGIDVAKSHWRSAPTRWGSPGRWVRRRRCAATTAPGGDGPQ